MRYEELFEADLTGTSGTIQHLMTEFVKYVREVSEHIKKYDEIKQDHHPESSKLKAQWKASMKAIYDGIKGLQNTPVAEGEGDLDLSEILDELDKFVNKVSTIKDALQYSFDVGNNKDHKMAVRDIYSAIRKMADATEKFSNSVEKTASKAVVEPKGELSPT